MDISRVGEGIRRAGDLVSDAYVAVSTNIQIITGSALLGLLSAEVAHINFRTGETGTGLWLSAGAVALEALAFHGAYLHDSAEAAEMARQQSSPGQNRVI